MLGRDIMKNIKRKDKD